MRIKKLIILFILLIVIGFSAFLMIKRAFSYGYNVRADYVYNFDSASVKIIPLDIKSDTIYLSLEPGYNTAFLEVYLDPKISGYFSQPELQMLYDSIKISQYFESGAKGIRYLNISRFVQHNAKKIVLKPHRCNVVEGKYKLILYSNLNVSKESLVVISPHPDDAEISANGLYSSNKNSFIVTVTAGDAGKSKYGDFYEKDYEHYLKKGELRVWNSITVPLLAGLKPENIVNLGYFDSMLKSMYLNDTLTVKSKYIGTDDLNVFRSKNISLFLDSLKATSNWRSLVNDLKFILKKRKPTIIVTPYPAIDFHLDHKFTTVALLQAIKELNYTNAQLWMYTNHYSQPDVYPIGEMGSATSLPPSFKAPGIYFNSIYSHPLSKKNQVDKLFALDAMNDLRHNVDWSTIGNVFHLLFEKITNKIYQHETDYYRRSVRDNELFFVVRVSMLYNEEVYRLIVGDIDSIVK